MTLTLHDVVQKYLTDQSYQKDCQKERELRDSTLSLFQDIISRFINGDTDLQTFRTELSSHTHELKYWGAQGPGCMMEINKLSKHHDEKGTLANTELHRVLTGLQVSNLGERIEQFYTFLLSERGRLLHEGKASNMIVAARNSAFILSLFVYWLHPDQSFAYYESLRKGLFTLIKADLVSAPLHIHLGSGTIDVQSASDHEACLALTHTLAQREPALTVHRYWIEYFCYWVTQHVQSLTEPSNKLVTETGADNILIQASSGETVPHPSPHVREQHADYALSPDVAKASEETDAETILLIKAEPLKATPEPLLTHLIHEVQRVILIDEAVIRRIYHALLAGHVILTGPPGTGKTDLARIIPETLWRSEMKATTEHKADETEEITFDTRTAYTTRLVTATDEWSVRTLISGIAPQSKQGTITYTMQYGYLTDTIQRNWSSNGNRPEEWSRLRRKMVTTQSARERGIAQTFRGQWLVIDEFNRAPIDLAFGDALTAIGGHDVLRVSIEGGSAELPIPQDFRVIGTLNSFDRNYLNQISEALKRRFSFVEILPPTRQQRENEQNIVLSKVLKGISHLSDKITISDDGIVYWEDVAMISPNENGSYQIEWENEQHPFRVTFDEAWHLFEVIRIYRQLGTAQAISLFRHALIAGILQGSTTPQNWIEQALDAAFCDTVADQLQVLMPDEIEVLLAYLTVERANFADKYHDILHRLADTRIHAQLLALGGVINDQGEPFLSDEQTELITTADTPQVPAAILQHLFHLDTSRTSFPQFTRRLRLFKAERGL